MECANLPGVQGAGPGAERMEIDFLEVVFVYRGTSAEDRVLKKDKKIYIYRPACIHDSNEISTAIHVFRIKLYDWTGATVNRRNKWLTKDGGL